MTTRARPLRAKPCGLSARGVRPRPAPRVLAAILAAAVVAGCAGTVTAPDLGATPSASASTLPPVSPAKGLPGCAALPGDDGRRGGWLGIEFQCLADGSRVRGNQLRGQPTVAVVWASWCGPCRRELPYVSEFARAQSRVRVVGIGWRDDPSALQEYARRNALGFPTLVDRRAEVAGGWNVQTQPAAVFISTAGKVTQVHRGELTSTAELRRLADAYAR